MVVKTGLEFCPAATIVILGSAIVGCNSGFVNSGAFAAIPFEGTGLLASAVAWWMSKCSIV